MSTERYFDATSAHQAAIRAAVDDVDQRLAHLAGASELTTAWAALVRALDLPPAHALRDCPKCGQVNMQAATRCGHCWNRLPPVP
jgi:hypothetical protein